MAEREPEPELRSVVEEVRRLRDQLSAMNAHAADEEATGLGADGRCVAVISGGGRLVSLELSDSMYGHDDPRVVTDAVVEAVNDAHRLLAERRERRVNRISGSFRDLAQRLRYYADDIPDWDVTR